ncbi:DNA adenine methylase [Limosilactobacillus sp. RRLNB_1_1]|uniref:site-specific DNA-methyltransferase (adenine-specific) n=1 Tax=Limosilactobacillus albertensis TaxID=2759752 RepID=A0A7W3Y8A4_9LACO|nr:DNA adenine methylase [Limosilactobacillus albertensis]MBB1069805.1 DNA adenine methylase [Limosilactobacillus albertensis]MCD7117683.1 DNA adenine methylase [Limosilactobacillus albertensis]MCD7129606.1 DNA adenine methylase [Limosilactobacillus albertensis]
MKIVDNIRDKEFHINNRRYLGSKERLLTFIDTVVKENTHNIKSVADIFAGTGVVADMFASEGKSIIVNDILHSNQIIYETFFGTQKYDRHKINEALEKINNITNYGDHYLEKVYGNKYFSKSNANKIGSARQWVEDNGDNFNDRERAILITSILYGADKVANTVGHYDAYRKKMDSFQKVSFRMPCINNYQNTHIYMADANKLVRNIKADLVYIDPPYNSRQYVDTYHVLENIADWNEPEVKGIARKSVDRKDRRSQYNLVKAPQAFEDLITHINSKYILVSFNNMAQKGAGRSNSKISHDEIIDTLSKRGKVRVFDQNFIPFTTGKTSIKNHKELLYLVNID